MTAAAVERRLQTAYEAVFGQPEARNDDQKLVIRDIETFCRAYRLSCEAVAGGEFAENNTLVNEGRRSVWLRIRGHVMAASLPATPPPSITRARKPSNP